MSGLFDVLSLDTTSTCQANFQASTGIVDVTNSFLPPLPSIAGDTWTTEISSNQIEPRAMEAAFADSRKTVVPTVVLGPIGEAAGISERCYSTTLNSSIAGSHLICHHVNNAPWNSSPGGGSSCDSLCLGEMVCDYIENECDACDPCDACDANDDASDDASDTTSDDGRGCCGTWQTWKAAAGGAAAAGAAAGAAAAGAAAGAAAAAASANGRNHPHGRGTESRAFGASSSVERLASLVESLSCCESPEEHAVLEIVTAAMKHAKTAPVDVSRSSTTSTSTAAPAPALPAPPAAVCAI
ncbi:hypothetical protein CLOP_g487 [Closterium sp. NIES-67]|nr:hypothetical protein CLOP_g487 [Closterium sp. NIES-67]